MFNKDINLRPNNLIYDGFIFIGLHLNKAELETLQNLNIQIEMSPWGQR